ncbi:MAG TPA: ABC transporter permease/substrate-binding protein [Alphaproteobacteria bacterium]|jgi:osmoprotectant transport system permease protein
MTDKAWSDAWSLLPAYLTPHIVLSAAALALGLLVSLPLAVAIAGRPRLRWPVLAVAGLIQTIPGLALLALFYPLLLALSAVTLHAFGFAIPALGFLPTLIALTLYAMLPILRNGVAGLNGVDPDVVEAAEGVGMTPRQVLLRVKAPLAAPVVMAGVRTAAVWTIGAATLSTPVGQTSLGNYIFTGLQTENWVSVLFGCIAAAALALVADIFLGLIETGLAQRRHTRMALGVAGLLLGTLAGLTPLLANGTATYTIGAKNFSEQFILAELMGERLKAEGASVAHKDGLGSAVAFRALAHDDIDVYVDYSGTLWSNVMGRGDMLRRDVMQKEIARWMKAEQGVTVLGPLGFENAYVLAMKRDRAATLGVSTLDDLARVAPQLVIGSDIEFLSRPEWTALKDAYGLSFKGQRSFNPTIMYRALETGEVDVISAFSSDGRMASLDLVALGDPKQAAPAYDALILLAPKRANDERLKRALTPLIGAIPVEAMRAANLAVDRDADKASPAQAARDLAATLHLQP